MKEPGEVVYVLNCPKTGLYKIGTTTNWQERMRQLQANSAFPLDIDHCIILMCPEGSGKLFEAILHNRFRNLRSHGEWFLLGEEELKWFDAHVVEHIFLQHSTCYNKIGESYKDYLAIPDTELTPQEIYCREIMQGHTKRPGFEIETDPSKW